MENFSINLSKKELEIIISLLGEAPYKISVEIINNIITQVNKTNTEETKNDM